MKKFKTAFEQDGLEIVVDGASSHENIFMTWRGMSDVLHPENELTTFLFDLIPELDGRMVKIDLCHFTYMNSATFGPLLQFIKSLNHKMIPTQVSFNAKQDWQRVTFRCMKVISQALQYVHVESLNV
jgi:hypothetical protein